jgi:hypothetical protein
MTCPNLGLNSRGSIRDSIRFHLTAEIRQRDFKAVADRNRVNGFLHPGKIVLAGPQLRPMMPEVSDRKSEHVLEPHLGLEAGIPPCGIAHGQFPMTRLEGVKLHE